MTIEFPEDGLKWKATREWIVDGHQVMLALSVPEPEKGDRRTPELHMLCECDYPPGGRGEITVGQPGDPEVCPARASVRHDVTIEQRKANTDRWNAMPLEDAIMDIHARVQQHEYFGQRAPYCIYVQQVAELLGREIRDVLDAVLALKNAERLDLHGMILSEYEQRFRLPTLLDRMMRVTVEIPLGWPNGDAGSGAVADFCEKMREHLDITHGKEAFGRHFPDMNPTLFTDAVCPALVHLLEDAKDSGRRNRMRRDRRYAKRAFISTLRGSGAAACERDFGSKGLDVMAAYLTTMLDVANDRIEICRGHEARLAKTEGRAQRPLDEAAILDEIISEVSGFANTARSTK